MKKKLILIITAVVVIATGLTITGISYFNKDDNNSNPLQVKKFSEFKVDSYKLKDSYDTKESLVSDYQAKALEIKEIVRFYSEEDAEKIHELFDSTVGVDFRARYQKYPQEVLTAEEQEKKDKEDYIGILNSFIEEEENKVKMYKSFIKNPDKADGDFGVEEGTEIYIS